MSEVVFVGTSNAFGAGGRRQSAILVRGRGGVLLDCGTTTCTGLAALGIERDEIDAVVISHFHADHFGGLPLLLLAALYEDERRRPLAIAGPPGVEERVRRAAEALGHGLDHHTWSFPLRFHELEAGKPLDLGLARASAFPVHHQPDACPHGLTLETDSRRIVYTGDTGWFEGLLEQAKRADLFICECTFFERDFEYHLNYQDLLPRVADFECKRMILTHLGDDMAMRRGRLEVETADDGLVISL